MAIQTRGQITLIATPDYRLQVSPQVITIPVNEDDSLLGGGSFSQEITINALDSLNNNLKFESVVFKNEKLTSNDGGYNWEYNWVPDLKNLANSGQLVFDVKLENNSDGAEDDYNDTVEVGWVKAKSGRDGTPAYGVNLWAKDQIFIKKLDENGVYIFEPNKIILTTTPINYEDLEGVSYKWFKDENENPIQTGGTTYEVKGNDAASGMYRVEVYNSEGTPIASDILGIGVATSGSEAFTVLLTNDSETVSTDRDKLSIRKGTVSTGILVYKGANQLTPNDYSVSLETEGDENDSDPGEEIINNISFSYENGLITGSYEAYKAIDTRLKIVITVGQTEFIKYFYVKSSLAGESAKMIKVTGPQFFTVLANGGIYPESIELIANPQNVEFGKWTYFEDNSEIDIEDPDKYLTIEKDSSFWGDKKILRIRAYSENEEYYDEYPIYKIDDGKNSYSIIPSNETINIITDAFGLPVENKRTYPISFKVFSGNEEASYNIEEEVTIFPSSMSSFVSVEKENSSTFKIIVERNEEMSYEFSTTQIDFTFKITGIDNSITKSIYLQPAQQGADAKRMSLSGPQVFRYNNATDGTINYNPTSTTISCLSNVYYKWYYKIDNTTPVEIGTPNTSLEILPNLSGWDNDKILYIIAKECDENDVLVEDGIFDEITLYKVRDGSDGSDSLFVYPLNPSVIFTEGEEGKLVRQTINCPIKAFVGNIDTEVSSLSVDGGFGQEKGYYSLSSTKNNITITVKNVSASVIDDERSGTILCTAVLEDTKEQFHTFKFPINWSIIKGGVEGNGINEIINYYYASPSNNIDDIPEIGDSAWIKNAIPSNYNTTNKYLWNYEYIDYSKIEDKPSEPFVIGVYGEEGLNGISVIGFEEWYQTTTENVKPEIYANGQLSGLWKDSFDKVTHNTNNPYLWVIERAQFDDGNYGNWVGPRLAGVWGKDGEQGPIGPTGPSGENGANGYNNAIIYLYSTTKTSINWTTDYVHYYFSTKKLSSVPEGWSQDIPENTGTIYVSAATAYSNTNSDIILKGEWSAPVKFVENGYNSATIFLYQRKSSTPAKPNVSLDYSFITGELAGELGAWKQSIPEGKEPCYVIQATASSSSINDEIDVDDWSDPIILVQNGEDGEDTSKQIETITKYYKLGSSSLPNGVTDIDKITSISGWTTSIPNLTSVNDYIWSLDYITYEDDSTLITNVKLDAGARSDKFAKNMYDGTFTLNMLAGTTTKATLNYNEGLYIANDKGYSLQANAQSLGIYKGTNNLQFGVYTEGITTSLLLKGTIYADKGKIGTLSEADGDGWTIQGESGTTPAAIYSGTKSSLKSGSDGVYIGTDGLSLSKTPTQELPAGNSLIYDAKKGVLTITGNIIADSLTLHGGLSVSQIDDLGKDYIRPAAGIYEGDGTSNPSNAADGDIYIQYSSSSSNTEGASVSISGTSTVFVPGKTRYASRSTYHEKRRYWNFLCDSEGQTYNVNYVKVGRANTSYNRGCCRMVITPIITGGDSVNSFTLIISGQSKTPGTGSSYDYNYYEGGGTLNISIFNSSTGTVPIAAGKITISGKHTAPTDLSVKMTGSIINRKTYYVVITAEDGTLFYVNSISFTGDAIGSGKIVSPAIKIRSSGTWHTLSGEGGLIEDKYTKYTLALSTDKTRLIFKGEGTDAINTTIDLPTGSVYTAGNGIGIDSENNIYLNSTKINLNGASYYKNIYIRSESLNLPEGSTGDICFVYEG